MPPPMVTKTSHLILYLGFLLGEPNKQYIVRILELPRERPLMERNWNLLSTINTNLLTMQVSHIESTVSFSKQAVSPANVSASAPPENCLNTAFQNSWPAVSERIMNVNCSLLCWGVIWLCSNINKEYIRQILSNMTSIAATFMYIIIRQNNNMNK